MIKTTQIALRITFWQRNRIINEISGIMTQIQYNIIALFAISQNRRLMAGSGASGYYLFIGDPRQCDL